MNSPIIITEYIEANCPYCRYVENSILRDLIVRRHDLNKKLVKRGHLPMPIIELKLIDVDANTECKEMQWFSQYSQKIGGVFTPAIRVGESGKVFYLWGKEKKDVPTEKQLSSTEKLKADLLNEIQEMLSQFEREPTYYDIELFNPKATFHTPPPRIMYQPFGRI